MRDCIQAQSLFGEQRAGWNEEERLATFVESEATMSSFFVHAFKLSGTG